MESCSYEYFHQNLDATQSILPIWKYVVYLPTHREQIMSRLNYRLNASLQRFNDWDLNWCQACNDLSQNLSTRKVFKTISRLGDGVFWYMLMTVLLLSYQGEALPAVLHMLGVAVVGTLIYKLIKHKTLRPRPFNVYPSIKCTGNTLDQYSFPSGHTMHAVGFSIVAVAYFPVLIWLVLPFSVLVALSRPILGLHYPSDVLMGALLGAILASTSLYW
jgi:undecaprenyl-diphosphatase